MKKILISLLLVLAILAPISQAALASTSTTVGKITVISATHSNNVLTLKLRISGLEKNRSYILYMKKPGGTLYKVSTFTSGQYTTVDITADVPKAITPKKGESVVIVVKDAKSGVKRARGVYIMR
jgi:hypothetical protein